MVLAILLNLIMIYMIYVSARPLVKNHQSDLNVVWYFFSLSITTTILLGMVAIKIGAIDKTGRSQGKTGDLFSILLNFYTDLNSDIAFAIALIALVLVPQILTYLFSGLFGCAKSLFFVEGSVTFFVWFVVKSFAVASGVGVACAVFGVAIGWDHAELAIGLSLVAVCLLLLVFAFSFLSFYRNTTEWVQGVQERTPTFIVTIALRTHRFLTRNR